MRNINPIYLTEDGLWYATKNALGYPVRAVRSAFTRNYANGTETGDYNTLIKQYRKLSKTAASTTNPLIREQAVEQLQRIKQQIDIINSQSRRGVDMTRARVIKK